MNWNLIKQEISKGNLINTISILKKTKCNFSDICDPENGWPLLFYTIKFGQVEMFDYFSGMDHSLISTDFSRNSGLLISAIYQNEDAFFKLLKKYRMAMNLANLKGQTPASIAIEKGNTKMINALVEEGLDVNEVLQDSEGSTLLHIASSWGYFDIVTLLMMAKALITATNSKGFTPVDYAYNEDMKTHLLYCAECLKNNQVIITPKRVDQEFPGTEVKENTGMAYVSYLKTIF
jgi:hypothetical protein